MATFDINAVSAEITAALPPNWYAGNLTVTHELQPRRGYPDVLYSVEFAWGQGIEGRPMYYGGKEARQVSSRRITVTATGASEGDLAAVARLLPSLEPLGGLPWPIEFDVSAQTIP